MISSGELHVAVNNIVFLLWASCNVVMSALASANARAFQTLCSVRRPEDILVSKFRLLAPKTKYRPLPTFRTTTRSTGVDFREWSIFVNVGTRTVDGEYAAGRSAVALTPR